MMPRCRNCERMSRKLVGQRLCPACHRAIAALMHRLANEIEVGQRRHAELQWLADQLFAMEKK